jgi:hypothetical protein
MDGRSFDRVTRLLSATGSRRQAMLALIGSAIAGTAPALAEAKSRRRGRGKARNRGRNRRLRAEAVPSRCCSTGACAPGPGKNLSKCCYEGQNLAGKNFKGANLGSAVFVGATLTKANFAGANLGNACLADAILTGAIINGSTNLGGAIFCRTTMPDGSTNDSGCGAGTACCPTCIPIGGACGAGGECCGDACLNGICPCANGMVDCDGDGVCEHCGSCDAEPCPADPFSQEPGFCCAGGFCSCGGQCCPTAECWRFTRTRSGEESPITTEVCQLPSTCVLCESSGPTCCAACNGDECIPGGPIVGGSARRRV